MEWSASDLVSMIPKPVTKVSDSAGLQFTDVLSVEEPLEIRISYGPAGARVIRNVSVTMRTPGDDVELAVGFLFTEGIISSRDQIKNTSHVDMGCASQKENIVLIELEENCVPNLMQADRNFYTTSSCGVCGKSSIQSIKSVSPFRDRERQPVVVQTETLYKLSDQLMSAQTGFPATGGIHASGLFSPEGDLILLREDVGRHNALDKMIGHAFLENCLPLDQRILLLSGRVSFELIQKAAMAGVSLIAAIGAPSSLAVELAVENDITLIGFLKQRRFNIYHLSDHVKIPQLV